MGTAYYVVAVLTALWVGFSAYALLARRPFVVEPLELYGVPRSWWNPLGAAKAAGAAGLLAGFAIPAVGSAAAIGLILYFLGASATALRAHSPGTAGYPLLYLAPVAATLALQLAR
ncbi:DoxX family protein [Nocardia sp. NPDC050697]|uniref:DoxX family protein n=1 Tax=Nocardia sp. NPDC050697 TaxID=3155158 RepID=UPI0033D8B97F